jgi:hypothetical protein
MRSPPVANFYVVLLAPHLGADRNAIQTKMNLALDWFRCNRNMWVVYTTRNAQAWYERLGAFAKPDGQLFVSRLDLSDRQGWMSKKFWEWLKKDRTGKGG